MRKMTRGILSLASLAALTLAGTADAASIISFGRIPVGTKVATVSGSTTTLIATSPAVPGSNTVTFGTIGDQVPPPVPPIVGRETFGVGGVGITSVGAATSSTSGGITTITQPFSGVISFLDNTNPAINYVTITFTNAQLTGTAGGLTVNLKGDNTLAGQVITFTSTDPRVIPFLTDPFRNFDFSFTGLNTGLAITGTGATATIAPFIATNEGGAVSTVPIPEPSSVVMASTAVLAGLGCFGYRRSRSRSL